MKLVKAVRWLIVTYFYAIWSPDDNYFFYIAIIPHPLVFINIVYKHYWAWVKFVSVLIKNTKNAQEYLSQFNVALHRDLLIVYKYTCTDEGSIRQTNNLH